jgi:hypothetical protein
MNTAGLDPWLPERAERVIRFSLRYEPGTRHYELQRQVDQGRPCQRPVVPPPVLQRFADSGSWCSSCLSVHQILVWSRAVRKPLENRRLDANARESKKPS